MKCHPLSRQNDKFVFIKLKVPTALLLVVKLRFVISRAKLVSPSRARSSQYLSKLLLYLHRLAVRCCGRVRVVAVSPYRYCVQLFSLFGINSITCLYGKISSFVSAATTISLSSFAFCRQRIVRAHTLQANNARRHTLCRLYSPQSLSPQERERELHPYHPSTTLQRNPKKCRVCYSTRSKFLFPIQAQTRAPAAV